MKGVMEGSNEVMEGSLDRELEKKKKKSMTDFPIPPF